MAYPLSHQGYLPISTSADANPGSLISSDTAHLAGTNAPAAEEAPQGPASRIQKRRTSKVHTGKSLSRSTSTPHLKGAGNMSDSDDKKRNKLGYQRISIACGECYCSCGPPRSVPCDAVLARAMTRHPCRLLIRWTAHCRRRKIRCLLAEGDPAQRCQNCIRLKKECVFYPVDQQNVIDQNRSQSSTKSTNPSSGVSPSPPELGSGRPFERARQFGSFPSLPSNAPPGYHGMPLESASGMPVQGDLVPAFATDGMSDIDVGRLPQHDFGYPPTMEGTRSFQSPQELTPHHLSSMSHLNESVQPTYWRTSPSGQATDFAPFPSSGPAAQPTSHDAPYTFSPPESHSWSSSSQPSTRSMSYSNPQEGAQHGYMPPQMNYQPQTIPSNPPATYPPLDVSRATMQAAVPGPHSAPVGTPVAPYMPGQPYMFQPQAPMTASPLPTQQSYPGQWYSDAGAFSQHQQGHDNQMSPIHGQFTSKSTQ